MTPHKPKCRASSFTLNLPRRLDIRRRAYEFEDKLAADYGKASVTAIPDEADPTIPRIVFASHHGFSQIIINQVSMGLMVNYSPDEWQISEELRYEYLKPRIVQMFSLLELLPEAASAFCGITHSYWIDTDLQDRELLNRFQKFYFSKIDDKLADAIIRFTHVSESKFFSNVVIQNAREWSNFDPNSQSRLPYSKANRHGIQVEHDLNDRYAYNERVDYYSNVEAGLELLYLGNQIGGKMLADICGALDA